MPFYSISTLHAWNCRLVPVFGFPRNALLFWLVWTKTPKEMRVHSRILLQTCCVDLIFLTGSLIAISVFVYQGSFSIFLMDGYFLRIFASIFNNDPIIYIILHSTVQSSFLFDIFSISVQFVYRYLVLNWNIHVNLCHYLLMLTLPFTAAFIVAISFFFDVEFKDVDAELKAPLNAYVDWDNSIYLVGTTKKSILTFLPLFVIFITFSINMFCGTKLVKFVATHGTFNPRMKELNKQLTKNLMILALFPLFNFLPTLIISALSVALMITGSQIVATIMLFTGSFFTSLFVWLPVVNPLVSIWINRPYRDVVRKFIGRIIRKNNSVTTIQP